MNLRPGLRSLRNGTAALLVAAVVSSAQAQDASHDWGILSFGASPRLALRYLLGARIPGSGGVVNDIARQFALMPVDGQPTFRFSAAPVLTYSRNVNGGVPGDTITILGLPFTISEDSQAKPGVLVGARVSAGARMRLRQGLAWDFSLGIQEEYAPRWSFNRLAGTATTCLLATGDRWTFADFCGAFYRRKTDTSLEMRRYLSARVGKVFAFDGTLAETSLTLQGQRYRERTQLMLTGAASWFHPGGNLYTASIGVGQKKAGVSFTTLSARLGMVTELWGKPTGFELGLLKEQGAYFFGAPMSSRTVSLTLRRPVTRRLSAQLVAWRKHSTVAAFSESSVEFNFVFSGLNKR